MDIDQKLDRIEAKLDNFLERIAVVETQVKANKGWIKIIMSAILGAISTGTIFVARYIVNLLNF